MSPLTTLIQQAIEDALGDEDEATTADTAQTKIIEVLFGANSGVTMAHIRDYANYRGDQHRRRTGRTTAPMPKPAT